MKQTTRRKFIQRTSILAGGMLTEPLNAGSVSSQAKGPGENNLSTTSAPERLRRQLDQSDVIQCPVVHDAISALLAAEHGFPVIMAGGSAMSASQFGFGDFGMMTITEMLEMTARMADAVSLPIIADADDAGGNPLNTHRAVRMFERAGSAGVLIEDLWGPRHLGSLGNGHLLSVDAMADKVRAAVDARQNGLVLIAGSQAIPSGRSAVEALDRMAAYAEAGADVVLVNGLPLPECPRLAELTKRPVLASTQASIEDLKKNGVKINVYSGQLLAIAAGAMDRALRDVKMAGRIDDYDERALTRERMTRLTQRDGWIARAQRYNALRF